MKVRFPGRINWHCDGAFVNPESCSPTVYIVISDLKREFD